MTNNLIKMIRILAMLIMISLLSSICYAPAETSAQPKTYEEILQMTPAEFAKLDPGQAMGALNKMSQLGNTKLTEFFREYARTRLDVPAQFTFDANNVHFSVDGLNAPNGNFLEFDSFKEFIKSKSGLSVSVRVKETGFEISATGKGSTKTLDAQGFQAVTFKDGKIRLDGNLVDPLEGTTVAAKDKSGVISLNGHGTMIPKGGKVYEFNGKSSLHPDGKILVEPSPAGINWVRVEGQRVIPKDKPVAVYTDASKFANENTYNKVLITRTNNDRVLINPIRQKGADGAYTGEFDIGRSINVMAEKGQIIVKEEIIRMTPDGTLFPSTREMTYDSFFTQLDTLSHKRGTYLKVGRNNNPAVVARLQNLLEIEEIDTNGNAFYGEETKKAVIEFQKKHGLTGTQADGVVGPNTYKQLSKEFNRDPSAIVIFTATDGSVVGISDNGLFKGESANAILEQAQAIVPRLDTGRQEPVSVGDGRYTMPGGSRVGYEPPKGITGYTPEVDNKGSWTFVSNPPSNAKETPGSVTYYYCPVWDPTDNTGTSHDNWRTFMRAVKVEGSGMVYNDENEQWYRVGSAAAIEYLDNGVWPEMKPLTSNLRFGPVYHDAGTPVLGTIAAPPNVPAGTKAYVKTVGGQWLELKVRDIGGAVQVEDGVYHIDIWAGVGQHEYRNHGGLTGKYAVPEYPQIKWVYPPKK